MNPKNDITQELKELGSPLAHFPRTTPFLTPKGYFDELEQLAAGAPFAGELPDPQLFWPKGLPFVLPDQYFQELPAQLTAARASAADPVLSLPKAMPFALPAGYFDTLPEEITLLASAPADGLFGEPANPFSLPEGYFAGLPGTLMARIREEENLAATALPEPETATPAGVPTKGRSRLFAPVYRWAAAAVVILGIGIGAYRGLQPGAPAPVAASRPAADRAVQQDIAGQLARLDKSVIYEYVVQNIDDFDLETLENAAPAQLSSGATAEHSLEQMDVRAIEAYLDESAVL